jgi:acyl carrier protein
MTTLSRTQDEGMTHLSTNQITSRIKRVLVKALSLPFAPDALADDEPLFGGLGVDSREALIVVAQVEREFGLGLGDDGLTQEVMASVKSLSEYVHRRLSSQAPSEAEVPTRSTPVSPETVGP